LDNIWLRGRLFVVGLVACGGGSGGGAVRVHF